MMTNSQSEPFIAGIIPAEPTNTREVARSPSKDPTLSVALVLEV